MTRVTPNKGWASAPLEKKVMPEGPAIMSCLDLTMLINSEDEQLFDIKRVCDPNTPLIDILLKVEPSSTPSFIPPSSPPIGINNFVLDTSATLGKQPTSEMISGKRTFDSRSESD